MTRLASLSSAYPTLQKKPSTLTRRKRSPAMSCSRSPAPNEVGLSKAKDTTHTTARFQHARDRGEKLIMPQSVVDRKFMPPQWSVTRAVTRLLNTILAPVNSKAGRTAATTPTYQTRIAHSHQAVSSQKPAEPQTTSRSCLTRIGTRHPNVDKYFLRYVVSTLNSECPPTRVDGYLVRGCYNRAHVSMYTSERNISSPPTMAHAYLFYSSTPAVAHGGGGGGGGRSSMNAARHARRNPQGQVY